MSKVSPTLPPPFAHYEALIHLGNGMMRRCRFFMIGSSRRHPLSPGCAIGSVSPCSNPLFPKGIEGDIPLSTPSRSELGVECPGRLAIWISGQPGRLRFRSLSTKSNQIAEAEGRYPTISAAGLGNMGEAMILAGQLAEADQGPAPAPCK